MRLSAITLSLCLVWLILNKVSFCAINGTACGGDCRNGGYCNETLDQCVCYPYFTSDSRCYNLSCSENNAVYYHNYCNCSDGWGGPFCTSCNNSDVCYEKYKHLLKHTNGTFVCDKTLLSYGQLESKVFNCDIKKEGIWSVIGEMKGVWFCPDMQNGTASRCEMQLYTPTPQQWGPWDKPPGYNYEIFYCEMRNCSQEAGTDSNNDLLVKYSCQKTKCACTGEYPCPDLLKNFLALVTGQAWFTCNDNSTWCTFEQEQLKFLMTANCTASECILNPQPIPPIPPPTPLNYAAIAITGGTVGGIVLLLIFCTILHFIYTRIRNRVIYENWKALNNAKNFDFSFHNISYSISKFGSFGKKQYILQDVSGYVPQGKLMAIMGASGAGKTSLLDILAGRLKTGSVTGDICVGGKPIDESYQLIKGYVLQENIIFETMTTEEYLMFSAQLRLPEYVSYNEKKRCVQKVMRDLGISHLANQRIGSNIRRGLSGGEKRRVAIGAELVVSKPIIFCDEPTSGLDSYNAYGVMSCLHDLARSQNKTIIVSIHQPSSSIFSLIDTLLILSEGKVAYSGPAKDAVQYFSKLGFEKPMQYSTPDFLLDLVAGSCGKNKELNKEKPEIYSVAIRKRRASTQSLLFEEDSLYNGFHSLDYEVILNAASQIQLNDPTCVQSTTDCEEKATERTTLQRKKTNLKGKSAIRATHSGHYMTSFYKQFIILAGRAFKNFIRNFFLLPAHILFAIFMGLFLGFVFYQMPMDLHGTQDRIGSLFFVSVVLSFVAMSSLEMFVSEREVFVTERASGYYRAYAYYLSRMVFDILPLRTIPPIVIGSICYFMMGLRQDSYVHFLWFILFLVLFNISIGGICLCISSVVQSVTVANLLFLCINLFTMLFGGFLVNVDSLPVPLKYCQFLSPYKYALEAILVNEMHGRVILFNPPDAEYTFQMRGEMILEMFGFSVDHFALDLGVVSGLALSSILLAGLLLQFCVKERR